MPYGDPIPALKQQLGAEIARLIGQDRGAEVAVLLHTDRGRVSNLRHGKLDRFSLETLVRFATRLSRCVDLVIVNPRARVPRSTA